MTAPGGASPPLLVIAGATATGKTALAIDVAATLTGEGIAAEIISADSRQVYRGLDIGTAKATPEERRGIPHHGLDLADPDETFTVADFAAHARAVLAGMAGGRSHHSRSSSAGPGCTSGPSPAASRPKSCPATPTSAPVSRPSSSPSAWSRWWSVCDRSRPRAPRRSMPATRDASFAPSRWPWPAVTHNHRRREPPGHREWIAARAARQFEAGLVDEARSLRERFDPALPAFSAIGYREAWAVLDGELTLAAAIAEDARRNQAFAKRQRTWFRSEPAITWLDATLRAPVHAAVSVARRLVSA